jgi:hypothetical protein
VQMEEQVSQILKENRGEMRVFKMMLKIRVMSMFTDVILTFSTRYRDAFNFHVHFTFWVYNTNF